MKPFLAAALSCLALGSVLAQPDFSIGSDSGDAAFAKLADEYIAGYQLWRPETATSLGFHQYDGKLTDLSKPSLNIELSRLKSFERRLAALDPRSLSQQSFYDFSILRGQVQHEIFSFEGLEVYTRNPMTYARVGDLSVYIKRDFAPLPQRVRSMISILKQAPKVMAAARQNLARSLPRPFIETAIEEADGAADFLGKDLVLALKDLHDDALMAEFNAANAAAIEQLRAYVRYLKDDKLPKANNDYALGRDKYVKLLEYGELITIPPEKILEIGMAELRHQQQAFADAAKVIDPTKKPVAVFKAIQKDHPTAQNLIPDTAKDLNTIRQFVVDHHIITIPSPVRPTVTETPQFQRATSFASMDTPGPFETKATEAYYYVTPVEPDWTPKQKEEWLTSFNYYTTDIVSTHEVYPGHYVQFLCLKASPATRLEKIFGSYAFIEGWAHYGEQVMVDEGFGGSGSTSPSQEEVVRAAKYRMAQADEALLRVCRLCVSIRMHCQGMKVPEATKFFEDNCYYEHKPSEEEAIRGTFDPEYLYYTLGKLEFFKLRADYKEQEGANYSLQKFNDEVNRHGAPPLRLLRELMLKERGQWGKVL